MNTQTTPVYSETLEITSPVKVKKLKLAPFDTIRFSSVAVTISEVAYSETEGGEELITHAASLVLWANAGKTKEHPVIVDLQMNNDCPYCLAYGALRVASVMADELLDKVVFYTSEGDIYEEGSADEIIEAFQVNENDESDD